MMSNEMFQDQPVTARANYEFHAEDKAITQNDVDVTNRRDDLPEGEAHVSANRGYLPIYLDYNQETYISR